MHAALPARLPWPLPALLAWAASWAVFIAASRWWHVDMVVALLLGAALAVGFSLRAGTRWRRVFIAWGFPVSLAASGLVGSVPAWAWLLPLVLLLAVYPMRSWRDAPVFPTPRGALEGLCTRVPLPPGASILDAGCGAGHGLDELRRVYPKACLVGMEWSWPLWLLCRWRVPHANVRRADIWAADWSGFDMVYLFQRPESMADAAQKAANELRPGAWLVSLEFNVPGCTAAHVIEHGDGRRVWVYRAPLSLRRAPRGS